jgi:hypothetical protein
MDNDFYDERPEQSDIFLLEREIFDEETSYFLRPDIIILLSGAPVPSLERDIARKLAEVHGQPTD